MSAAQAGELREAFGSFITGVTVVTAMGDTGVPVGFTANSFTSVSLDPPLLLVCPSKSLTSFPVFNTCENFTVNILAENQQDISNVFATAVADRFGEITWRQDKWNCPVIDGVAASFCCSAHSRLDAGDHIILMGEVKEFHCSGAAGLGYSRDGYFSLGLERKTMVPPQLDTIAIAGAIIEFGDKVLIEETPDGLRLPRVTTQKGQGVFTAVNTLMAEAGLRVEFGPVYSIFENKNTNETHTYYRGVAAEGGPNGLGNFVTIEDLASRDFISPALTTMMQRYFLEQKSGIFGLYVGDDDRGDVHMFGEEPNR